MQVVAVLVAAACFSLSVEAQNVICGPKTTTKSVTVEDKQTYSFKTQKGKKYKGGTTCTVDYKMGDSCTKMSFVCKKFNINNKDKKKCTKGDKVTVTVNGKPKVYCKTKKPKVFSTGDMSVVFESDKKKHGPGAVCKVKCTEAATSATTEGTDKVLFNDFLTKYNKTYSKKEKAKRLKIWKKRMDEMKEHNMLFDEGNTHTTYRKGENAMFDMELDEIEVNYMGLVLQHNFYASKVSKVYIDISSLPSSINWVEKGYVTSVQNQAGCGSSWAHSAAGALEGAYKNNTNKLVKINVDDLIDCATLPTNGCEGSYPSIAFSYVMATGIVIGNETYRSHASNNSQASNKSHASNKSIPKDPLHETHGTPKHSLQKIHGFPIVHPLQGSKEVNITDSFLVNQHDRRSQCSPQSTNVLRIRSITSLNHGREDELTQALAEIGPVSVSICASLDLVDYAGEDDVFYKENCREDCKSHSGKVNHAVLVVGYGEQKNKRTNISEPYWLVKNSWGTGWGNEGYIKMSRSRKNNCGIASYATFPSVWGHFVCGEDLTILLALAEGQLDIKCCGQDENITCISDECTKACGEEPIQCLELVEEFTNTEECDNMNLRIAQVKISRALCKHAVPCPTRGSTRGCSCCKFSFYYRGYKNCAQSCNEKEKTCLRSAPVIHDVSDSDLICQDSLNETDVSEDVNVYFSSVTDAGISLRVLCCNDGKTTAYNCSGSECSELCGGDSTCIKMIDTMEYSDHCYDDVMLVPRTEDSCKFAPCPSIKTNTKFCKCCEFSSYKTKCPETCSSDKCPQVQGILIAGQSGAEMFFPRTGQNCTLADVPVERGDFTLNTVDNTAVLCGGFYTLKSCQQFNQSSGVWTRYGDVLKEYWSGHNGWVSPAGLVLFGGEPCRTCDDSIAEIVNGEMNFTLNQWSLWSCSIQEGPSTIITGGFTTSSDVFRYNLQGYVEDLPSLREGRWNHGCGSYQDGGDRILVVSGGWNGSVRLSSTEVHILGGPDWNYGGSLPRAMDSMAYVSLDQELLFFGGYDGNEVIHEILAYRVGVWKEVGQLVVGRRTSAATKILVNTTACD